jgi:ATP-binding protein involved in chromosome partitioning
MSEIIKERVLQELTRIMIEGTAIDLVAMGAVSAVVYRNENVGFAIEVDQLGDLDLERLRAQCVAQIKQIPPVKNVTIVMTGETPPKSSTSSKSNAKGIPAVEHIIAVASCKGGVGKSTITVNLAVALAQLGYGVGLVDADIYGPSIPKMMGIHTKPVLEKGQLLPVMSYGIKVISMGLLLDENIAAIWRGPMSSKALHQLLRGTNWGKLDILLVDTPPGTGDIALSLVENYNLAGVVMVTTPQAIAMLDVQKSIAMYDKLQVNILGLIENMSYFLDPVSLHKSYIFGAGGGAKLAHEHNVPLLGSVPIDISLREAADNGKVLIKEKGISQSRTVFLDMATKIAKSLENSN